MKFFKIIRLQERDAFSFTKFGGCIAGKKKPRVVMTARLFRIDGL